MNLDGILQRLGRYRQTAESLRDILVGNTVLLGEIPAPTGSEGERVQMLVRRFQECGLSNVHTDRIGNGMGLLTGSEREQTVLLLAHVDTHVAEGESCSVQVMEDTVVGAGLADNGLGLAVLVAVPTVLSALGLRLKSDLILVGDVRSLEHGNLAGIDAFLSDNDRPIRAAICIEGGGLGRLSLGAPNMMRFVIRCVCDMTAEAPRSRGNDPILAMADVVRGIAVLAERHRNAAEVLFGRISGGGPLGRSANQCRLWVEVRSPQPDAAEAVHRELHKLCEGPARQYDLPVHMDMLSARNSGALHPAHPLSRSIRSIHRELGLKTRETVSVSELSSLIRHNIPALTLGMAERLDPGDGRDVLNIDSAATGMAQLVGILQAIDEGVCDES